ncbi:pyruvate kinase [Ruminiclostridium sufflavum DSM 19573]|uniref:Pyruvate kinase n=1 Tax=Ruminiclostridium sufflavum DSM 19573 TaxID=1121337 RepID=A0A318XJU7_9FIRM|nr:pyruvate kinase [Ruminiclostridium sufflavum]PYG87279.1 pyruvate kinase [Ruminiclostridium sufflavum DSM 19573]
MRKTKIICTLGPASDNEAILRKMMLGGMNVARMNFSHGTHEEHKKRADLFKRIREELQIPIPLLLDTKGPEIRTGSFKDGKITLKEGADFVLVNKEVIGDEAQCTISYKELYKDVSRGSKVLIDDGLVELEVVDVKNKDINCVVINGGTVGNHKGINVPGAKIKLPALTAQDIEDIKFGIQNDFDIIAASFVRKAADVVEIRKILEKNSGSDILIVSKIENREGITNFDEILKVSDGIMVARGDLGVEIPVEEVPIVQKNIIQQCFKNGKPVITATQMLDSMIRNPRPTRAEASDVANAIFDGTSGVMLSGETASGKYPVEALEVMGKIAEKAESAVDYWKRFNTEMTEISTSVTNAISHATCTTAMDLKASAIITVTQSGHTARMIARFRPACPIIATTVKPKVQRQLNLSWGVIPYMVKTANTTDEMFDTGIEKALESGQVKNGDLAVITAGVPTGISGTTNTLKVHIVGKVLVQGIGIGEQAATGELSVALTPKDAVDSFVDGNILVAPFTDNSMLPVIKRAAAVVVEEGGHASHTATVGLALDIPVIVGAENATKILKSGSVVTVDAERGLVLRSN